MRSIRTKLIVFFNVLFLVSLAIVGVFTIQFGSSSLKEEAEQSLNVIAKESAKLTFSRVETQLRTLEMLSLREDIQSMDWEVQQPILQRQIERTNFLEIGVVTPDGTAHYSDGSTAQLGDRDYIQRAFNGEVNVSDVIISRVTNEPVLMYAAPIERDGNVVGVLIGRRVGTVLSDITKDTGYGETGYAYMINSKGTVVAHPDTEKVMNQFNPIEAVEEDQSLKSLATLFEKILKDKTGISDYSFEGEDLYAAYTPIEGTDWYMVVTVSTDEILSAVSSMQKQLVIYILVILVLMVPIIFVIGNSIAKPIIVGVERAKKIADLDITENISEKHLKRKDEVGGLAIALQDITDNLRGIVKEINYASEEVVASSEELTAISQQSATSAIEVSKTIEEIAQGASDQAQNTEEGSSKATILGETIEREQTYTRNVNKASNRIEEKVAEGLKEIDNLSKITEESSEATNEVYEVILKTNESSQKIGQASGVISSIANQTNLLALNAAIEAARAGDAGRGFSVVAEEIRKLAEESSKSTKSIDEMVIDLQSNAGHAVETMERVAEIAKEQASSAKVNKEKYMTIQQAVNEAKKAVEELNSSGEEMENMKNEILNVLQNLSATAEENSAATEEVAATMEEQTASMESIAEASEELSSLSQKMQAIIAKFKTS